MPKTPATFNHHAINQKYYNAVYNKYPHVCDVIKVMIISYDVRTNHARGGRDR